VNRIVSFEDVRAGIKSMVENVGSRLDLDQARDLVSREAGFKNWAGLLESLALPSRVRAANEYERAAQDFVNAHEGDAEALERLNRHYERSFSFEDLAAEIWRRVYAYRQRAFKKGQKSSLKLEEAQILVAQDAGFSSWTALMQAAATGGPPSVTPYE